MYGYTLEVNLTYFCCINRDIFLYLHKKSLLLIEKVNAHSILRTVHLVLQGEQVAFTITKRNMCIISYKYLAL